MQKIFLDSVNLIVHRCDTKNNKYVILYCWNSKVTSVFNFIPSKFWCLSQEVSKAVLLTVLNVHREISGSARFVTNILLVYYKWSKIRSSSYTTLVFPVTFTKVCPITIQSNMHSSWIEINEIPKFKLYDNIGDLSKTTFLCMTMTPREALGLCCVHIAQLMTHPAIYTLPFTLQLCYKPLHILQTVTKKPLHILQTATKSQKIHISSHDDLQKLHNINFAWKRSPRFSQREGRETGISSVLYYVFLKQS